MRMYLEQNVYDAALDRIRFLYREFPNIHVNYSGGKDSVVVLHLTLQVAEELGRLPVKVTFIDQEAEWQTVIDHIREVMADPRVRPFWYQIPIKLFNATSVLDPWLYCWEERKEGGWIRPKEPDSIHENIYGTDRFAKLFEATLKVYYPDTPACHIAGVRCEESPARALGLTSYETYKGVTWGSTLSDARQHFNFYPIYDWSYTDVWKAIHDNDWPYCRIYDYMYQHGVPTQQMRVSNVHHETAVRTLFYLQEIESETWDKITARLAGINTAGQLQGQFFRPKALPFMFKDWQEYRDHLLEHLITDGAQREQYRRQFAQSEARYHERAQRDLVTTHIDMLLNNDYHGTKLSTFAASHMFDSKRRGRVSGRTN